MSNALIISSEGLETHQEKLPMKMVFVFAYLRGEVKGYSLYMLKSGCLHMPFIPGVFKLFEGFLCLAGALWEQNEHSATPRPRQECRDPSSGFRDIRVKEWALIQGAEMEAEKRCPLPLDLCSQVLKGRIWLKMAKIVAYRCILFVRCYLLIGILLFEFQAHISRMSLSQISSSLKIFLCSSQTFANIFFLLWKKVLTSINILIIWKI